MSLRPISDMRGLKYTAGCEAQTVLSWREKAIVSDNTRKLRSTLGQPNLMIRRAHPLSQTLPTTLVPAALELHLRIFPDQFPNPQSRAKLRRWTKQISELSGFLSKVMSIAGSSLPPTGQAPKTSAT
jgi:hypothetical protein